MKQFTSKNQQTGLLGENIVSYFLKKNGFSIQERNYTKKCGEIDIIATKNKKIHFIEVKAINVSYETYPSAENLHRKKLERIKRTIETYLQEKNVSYETNWQIDLYMVFINKKTQKHKIKRIENLF